MANEASQDPIRRIAEDRILKLETEAGCKLYCSGVVVMEDKLIVIDNKAWTLKIYNRLDGKLMFASKTLEYRPIDICIINETEVAVCLSNGLITILSWKSNEVIFIKTLNVRKETRVCYSVAKLNSNSDRLLVSGRNNDDRMLWWSILSIKNERLGRVRDICKEVYGLTHIAIKQKTVFVSCRTLNPKTNGVHAYDIGKQRELKFLYTHRELKSPGSVMVDSEYVYVCDRNTDRIHQITDNGQLVVIYRVSSVLCGIFYDGNQGIIYTNHDFECNDISVYNMGHSQKPGVPLEILRMDERSIKLYEEALRRGEQTVYNIRVMVVGYEGVGKTTLVKRLLGEDVDTSQRNVTEGIDIHVNCFDVSLSTHEWTPRKEKDSEEDYVLQKLTNFLNEKQTEKGNVNDDQDIISLDEDILEESHADVKVQDAKVLQEQFSKQDIGQQQNELPDPQQEVSTFHQQNESPTQQKEVATQQEESTSSQQEESTANGQEESPSNEQEKSTSNKQEESTSKKQEKSTSSQQEESTSSQQEESTANVEYTSANSSLNTLKKLKETDYVYTINATGKTSFLTIWDFAGQYAYYTTHQTFLTRQAIYLLVLDVHGKVTDIITGKCYFDSDGVKDCNMQEIVEVWLNSIHSCASSPEDGNPPVILVGTHVDKISPQDQKMEICKTHFDEIRTYLKDKPTRFHLIDTDFAIDNTVVDTNLEDLKKKIVEVASQQSYWGEKKPATWLVLEQELMKRKADGIKVISHEEVENINKDGTVQIENNELDLFLRYLHETGIIIYFSIEVLKNKIVLDPTLLIDALKSLINAQTDQPGNSADGGTHTSSTSDGRIAKKWMDFKGKGILSKDLIDLVWTKDKYPDLNEHKDYVLDIMEKLNIIAKPNAFSRKGVEESKDYFLVPCMLHQGSPREIISPEPDLLVVSTPVMCCVFKGKFLPPPIFHRLIAACVTRWPVAKRKETSEYLIFCGCCIFDLDLFHRLILHCKNHIVFGRITRKVDDEVKTPDAKLCTKVRKFITMNLSNITSNLGQSLDYDLCTWLPPQDVSKDDHVVPFQMWIADEEHDPNAPITPEHMNHARVCVALVTVCANALREILLTHFHVPFRNIYQEIFANKDNLTKKTQNMRGQWQKELLNSEQRHMVFPDPSGQDVGSVDQFDISLLYILTRNISTAPVPSMGWGNDPDLLQPRDTSIGASVERIRLYRNQIGHSKDGELSEQDFVDFWLKIDKVLEDIEQALGREGYREQFKEQERHVISVYEAC